MCVSVYAVPNAPESVNAVVIAQPPGRTVVKVSWKPPRSGTGIATDRYSLDFGNTQTRSNGPQLLAPGVSLCEQEVYICVHID